jgi:hypothetical protein
MPPKKELFYPQANCSDPVLPPGGFIHAPSLKAKVPPKARRLCPPQGDPSPSQSLFDLMPPLMMVNESLKIAAGSSSQVCTQYYIC